jgi:hypothetical protein
MNPWGVAVVLIGVAGLIWLTNPPELRRFRYVRIALSVPLLYVIGAVGSQRLVWGMTEGISFFEGLAIVASVVGLAIIWAGGGAWLAARTVSGLMETEPTKLTGPYPEFRFARNCLRDGDLEGALAEAKRELKKDGANFEGLMLLSDIYQDLNSPSKAIAALGVILKSEKATDDQKKLARDVRNRILKCRR